LALAPSFPLTGVAATWCRPRAVGFYRWCSPASPAWRGNAPVPARVRRLFPVSRVRQNSTA
jgi:hypothetical protein